MISQPDKSWPSFILALPSAAPTNPWQALKLVSSPSTLTPHTVELMWGPGWGERNIYQVVGRRARGGELLMMTFN